MPESFNRAARLVLILGLLVAGLSLPLWGQVPNPPGTGPFTVQMFIGGTQYTYLCLNPPTTYTDGTAIPNGTAVTIKIYRSMTGLPGSFTAPVTLASGGTGSVGMGAAGTQQKPWIDITAITPVDCIEPRIVFLAATSVVNGVEGPQTTNDLSFRYAVGGAPGSTANCYPQLIRYATPAEALATVPGGGAPPATTPPGTLPPNPPGTGPFTVQMFIGGTQYAYLCLNPPTTYVDGSAIPQGTPVQIKIYRSLDGGATYTTPVSLASGGQGTVGMGAAGTQQKPWIDITAITPVDCIEPRIVFLAATAVVGGVESAQTTNNLTFRYAIEGKPGSTENCYPILIRYATPFGAGTGQGTRIPTGPPLRPGGGGGGGGGGAFQTSIALVIDMSGSMNEQAGTGGKKVDIAKAAAVEALKQMPAGVEVCLFSFGRAGCDVNLERGFTTDFAALSGAVMALNGNGQTPLAQALYKARDYIVNSGSGLSGQIILLSDGMETCGGKPEKAAEDVRNKAFSQPTTERRGPGFSLFPMLYAEEFPSQIDPYQQQQPPAQASPLQLTPQQLQDEQQRVQNYASQDPAGLPPDESQPQTGVPAGAVPPTTGAGQPRTQMPISVSTIGLGLAVNSQAQQALDRIAQLGGGQSYSAQNIGQLTKAFTQAIAQPQPGPGGGGGGPIIPGGGGISGTTLLVIALLAAIVIILVVILIVRRSGSAAAPASGLKVRASVEIVWSDGRRQTFLIDRARTTVGRAPDNVLVVSDGQASTHHAEINVSPSGFSIRDLGSSNGTLVNGRRVTDSPLYIGDTVQIGSTKLILRG
jgi:hypothetical protein